MHDNDKEGQEPQSEPSADAQSDSQVPASQSDMVALQDADIEDLDAALSAAQEAEKEAQLNTAQSQQQVDDTQQPGASQGGEAQSTTQQQNPLGSQGDNTVAAPGADSASDANQGRTYTEAELQEILANNQRQSGELNQKELFINKRSNELTELRNSFTSRRSELERVKAQLLENLEDKFQEDPVAASNDRDKVKEIDAQLDSLGAQEKRAESIVEAQTLFLRHVDTEKVELKDISDVLRSEGVDERYIAQFESNPWEFTSPEALVQMGKRAMDRKEYSQAYQDRQVLAQHVLALNAEIEQLKARPNQVVSQIQSHLNAPPPMTSQGQGINGQVNVNVTDMSNEELDAALRSAQQH